MFKLLILLSPVEIWDLSTFGILTLCMISNHTLEVCIWEFGCHSVWILLRWTSCKFYIEGEVEDSDHLTNVNFAATAKPAHRNKPANENISLLKVIYLYFKKVGVLGIFIPVLCRRHASCFSTDLNTKTKEVPKDSEMNRYEQVVPLQLVKKCWRQNILS